MTHKVKNHSVLLVKDKEAKQGDSWLDLARERSIKQHGDTDELPENDAHAIRKYEDHNLTPRPPEETKAALSLLEEQIKELQEREKRVEKPKSLPPLHKSVDETLNYSDD